MTKTQSDSSNKKQSTNARVVLVWIIAVVIFLMMLSSFVGLFIKYRAMRLHIQELKQEQTQLQQKKATLTTTNEYVNTPEGKEEIFRDKYRLVKPGEGMIIITQDDPKESLPEKKPALTRFWESILQGLGLR